jgi:hypothetical protein
MRSLQAEPRPIKPIDFDEFVEELGLVADCEGAWALVGAFWFAPQDACRYLASQPVIWEYLYARARFADARRWDAGVRLGRGVGV